MNLMNEHYQKELTAPSKQSLTELAEIRILLRSYDAIFSDFGPRPYSERTLSYDFIIQAKKRFRNKRGEKVFLKLLLPANKRNEQDEDMIVKRIHSYFKNVNQQLKDEVRKTNKKGLILTLIEIVLMMAASYISFMKPEKYYVHFLLVLFEPAGWFLVWVGLDHLVYSSKEAKKDLDFYLRVTKSEIKFFTY